MTGHQLAHIRLGGGSIDCPLPKDIVKQKCEGRTLDTTNLAPNMDSSQMTQSPFSCRLSICLSVYLSSSLFNLCIIRVSAVVGGPAMKAENLIRDTELQRVYTPFVYYRTQFSSVFEHSFRAKINTNLQQFLQI